MKILVVGGAGYIGSHAAALLNRTGHEAIVLDNLSLGHAEAARRSKSILIQADLGDPSALEQALRERKIEAVMHFAAFASVPESVAEPAKYYRNNVIGTLNLLDAMRASGVSKIVFSSTAAVYGIAGDDPIPETAPKAPINPYGFTKLAIERALADYADAYGLASATLRYFNACGASDDGGLGEDHTPETHLIPIVLEVALGQRPHVQVFGDDYPTADGSCVRDYIHVEDLAEAHRLVLERLEPAQALVYNVGTGRGASVLQVVEAARRVTGRPIPIVKQPRRAGDPPTLVADGSKLREELGWSPRYDRVEAAIQSAWLWHSKHPRGYST